MNGDRPLTALCYNYIVQKVLYLIPTENPGITKANILYLSKEPKPFSNVAISTVYFPLVMSKLFGSVKEVESHKKLIQSYLLMGKYWVTNCGWIRLFTIVAMVTNITNIWKLFVSNHN